MKTKLERLAEVDRWARKLVEALNTTENLFDTPTKAEDVMLRDAATLVFHACETLERATVKR